MSTPAPPLSTPPPHDPEILPASRIDWLDHVKALGIFLVVWGHSLALNERFHDWLYAFHLPLFFLVSGYLMKPRQRAESYVARLRKIAGALGPPYLIFALVGYAAWFLVLRKFGDDGGTPASPLLTFLSIPYGTGTPEPNHVNPIVLWFFPCLFVSQAIALGLLGLGQRARLAISAALAAIGFLLPAGLALPLETETALVAQGFVILGYEARRSSVVAALFQRPLAWGLGFLVVGTFFALLNGRTDLRTSAFSNPLYYLVASLGLSLATGLLVSRLPYSRITAALGKNTIIIFPLHMLVFSAFAFVYVFVLRQELAIRSNAWVGFIASILNCALILLLAVPFCRRWMPWTYGMKLREPRLAA